VISSDIFNSTDVPVVVVAEVTASRVPPSVSLAEVVAVHADPDDVPGQGAAPDDDLGWYATQEIPDLLG